MCRSRLALLVVAVLASDAFAQATDLAGDPLPAGAIARIGTIRYRVSGGWHQQAFFSPDAKTLISCAEDGVLRFWDASTGKAIGQIKDPDLYQTSADVSPDGNYLAVFGLDRRGKPAPDSTLRLYDVTTRKPVWSTVNSEKFHSGDHKVRFTPDGKHIVTAAQDMRVWDAKSGQVVSRQPGVGFIYGGFDVSRDGKTVAFGQRQFYLWDWEIAEPRKIDPGLRTSFDSLCFSPNGKTVYLFGASAGGTAVDVATGKPTGRLEAGPGVRWVSFSPDGQSFAVGHYNTGQREAAVFLRSADTGKQLASWPCGTDQPSSGNWSRDGSRFAAVTRHRVWVWDVKTGKLLGPDVPAHQGIITGMTFASDGRLFTTSDDHTIRAWDSTTGKEVLKLAMDGWARGMDVTLSGALVAGNALQNDFRLWDAKTGEQIFKLLGHGRMGGLRRVRFSNDEQTLLSFADDGYLRKWDTLTGKLKAEHRFRSRNPLSGLDDDDEENNGMAFFMRAVDLGPDGNTFVMANGKHVSVYAADTSKERFKIEADPWTVDKLILSPDGKRLATAGPGITPPMAGQPGGRPKDCQITIWDLNNAKPIVQFRVLGSTVAGVLAFTPDGKKVVTASSLPTMYFWDAVTGESAGAMSLAERPVAAAFTPDGKRAAVAYADTTVLVYDLAASIKAVKKE